jgi:hypothetical protein
MNSAVVCSLHELDLFEKERIQASIVNEFEVVHKPISTMDLSNSIQFNCQAAGL